MGPKIVLGLGILLLLLAPVVWLFGTGYTKALVAARIDSMDSPTPDDLARLTDEARFPWLVAALLLALPGMIMVVTGLGLVMRRSRAEDQNP